MSIAAERLPARAAAGKKGLGDEPSVDGTASALTTDSLPPPLPTRRSNLHHTPRRSRKMKRTNAAAENIVRLRCDSEEMGHVASVCLLRSHFLFEPEIVRKASLCRIGAFFVAPCGRCVCCAVAHWRWWCVRADLLLLQASGRRAPALTLQMNGDLRNQLTSRSLPFACVCAADQTVIMDGDVLTQLGDLYRTGQGTFAAQADAVDAELAATLR
jgi:hypothetical protein